MNSFVYCFYFHGFQKLVHYWTLQLFCDFISVLGLFSSDGLNLTTQAT